jgi:transcriptional regulator with XRE-family HTH domain
MAMKLFRLRNPYSCQNNDPIVRFIVDQAFKQQMTMYDLSQRSGMSKDTIRHWRHRSTPRLSDAEAVLNVLGYTLKPVKIYRKSNPDIN